MRFSSLIYAAGAIMQVAAQSNCNTHVPVELLILQDGTTTFGNQGPNVKAVHKSLVGNLTNTFDNLKVGFWGFGDRERPGSSVQCPADAPNCLWKEWGKITSDMSAAKSAIDKYQRFVTGVLHKLAGDPLEVAAFAAGATFRSGFTPYAVNDGIVRIILIVADEKAYGDPNDPLKEIIEETTKQSPSYDLSKELLAPDYDSYPPTLHAYAPFSQIKKILHDNHVHLAVAIDPANFDWWSGVLQNQLGYNEGMYGIAKYANKSQFDPLFDAMYPMIRDLVCRNAPPALDAISECKLLVSYPNDPERDERCKELCDYYGLPSSAPFCHYTTAVELAACVKKYADFCVLNTL